MANYGDILRNSTLSINFKIYFFFCCCISIQLLLVKIWATIYLQQTVTEPRGRRKKLSPINFFPFTKEEKSLEIQPLRVKNDKYVQPVFLICCTKQSIEFRNLSKILLWKTEIDAWSSDPPETANPN